MKSRLFLIALLLTSSFFIKAEIAVLHIEGVNSSSSCEGEITIRATGTAGPFDVEVVETGEIINTTEGDVLLINICAGQVTINVSPVSFPHCVTVLNVVIPVNPSLNSSASDPPLTISDEKDQSTSLVQEIQSPTNQILISPNPSHGKIQVRFNQELPPNTKIEIYNALGQSVFREETKTTFKQKDYDFSNLPTGQYFLLATPIEEQPLKAVFVIN